MHHSNNRVNTTMNPFINIAIVSLLFASLNTMAQPNLSIEETIVYINENSKSNPFSLTVGLASAYGFSEFEADMKNGYLVITEVFERSNPTIKTTVTIYTFKIPFSEVSKLTVRSDGIQGIILDVQGKLKCKVEIKRYHVGNTTPISRKLYPECYAISPLDNELHIAGGEVNLQVFLNGSDEGLLNRMTKALTHLFSKLSKTKPKSNDPFG